MAGHRRRDRAARRRDPARPPRRQSPRAQEGCDRPRHRHRRRGRADGPRPHRGALSGARGAGRGARERPRRAAGPLPVGLRPSRRHRQLRARPAHLLLLPRAGSGPAAGRGGRLRPHAPGAVHRRTGRRGLAERRAPAGVRHRFGARRDALHGVPLRRARQRGRSGRAVRRLRRAGARGAAARLRRPRPVLPGGGSVRRLLGAAPAPLGHVGGQPRGRGGGGAAVAVRRRRVRHPRRRDRRLERADSRRDAPDHRGQDPAPSGAVQRGGLREGRSGAERSPRRRWAGWSSGPRAAARRLRDDGAPRARDRLDIVAGRRPRDPRLRRPGTGASC